MAENAVSIFISYSHDDVDMRKELERYLLPLVRNRLVSSWDDRSLSAAAHWSAEIEARLKSADLIVMLLSQNFLQSDYIHHNEVPLALDRHRRGEVALVPVLLSNFDFESSPLKELQCVPTDKAEARLKPVNRWTHQEDAFLEVISHIRKEAEAIHGRRREQAERRAQAAQEYRQKVDEMLSDHVISLGERDTLDEERERLGLTEAEADAVEADAHLPLREYAERIEKYKKTLIKHIELGYPFSEQQLRDLANRQRDLGLKDEDAAAAREPLLARAEAARKQAAERPATPPPAPVPVHAAAPVSAPAPVPAVAMAESAPASVAPDAGWQDVWAGCLVGFLGQHQRDASIDSLHVGVLPNKLARLAAAHADGGPPLALVDLAAAGEPGHVLVLGPAAVAFDGSVLGPGRHVMPYEALARAQLRSDGARFHAQFGDGEAVALGADASGAIALLGLLRRLGGLRAYFGGVQDTSRGRMAAGDVPLAVARVLDGFANEERLDQQSADAWAAVWGASLHAVLTECVSADVTGGNLFVDPDIPPKKLANARETCEVPEWEIVVGLYDGTVFGSAKDGLVFGLGSMYFHNPTGTTTGAHEVDYDDFFDGDLAGGEDFEIELEEGVFFTPLIIKKAQAVRLFAPVREMRRRLLEAQQRHAERLTEDDVDPVVAALLEGLRV